MFSATGTPSSLTQRPLLMNRSIASVVPSESHALKLEGSSSPAAVARVWQMASQAAIPVLAPASGQLPRSPFPVIKAGMHPAARVGVEGRVSRDSSTNQASHRAAVSTVFVQLWVVLASEPVAASCEELLAQSPQVVLMVSRTPSS